MTVVAVSPEPTLPRVTVVMPVRNEVAFIGQNLEALLAQDYPADRLEVIVADGRSDDGTREVVGSWAERSHGQGGASIVLVDNPERVMPTGTNAAIRKATGQVIVLLGGHAQLPSDYVRTCVTRLLETGADCVGGSLRSVGHDLVGEAIAAAMSSPFGVGNSSFRVSESGDPVDVDTVPFGAYRRDVFDRVGLFNPHMVRHQDYEFHYRLRRAGGRILLLPGLKATYHVRGSLAALRRQYWQYGVWKGRFLRRYPESLRGRHLAPALFVLALVATGIAAFFSPLAGVLFGALAGSYVGFVVAALVSFAASGRGRLVPVLPFVLACLHLGYGAGVWLGLVLPPVADAPRLDT